MQTHMVDVVRPCWISKLEPFNGMWHLSENGKPRGQFDAVVVAHNGEYLLPTLFIAQVFLYVVSSRISKILIICSSKTYKCSWLFSFSTQCSIRIFTIF